MEQHCSLYSISIRCVWSEREEEQWVRRRAGLLPVKSSSYGVCFATEIPEWFLLQCLCIQHFSILFKNIFYLFFADFIYVYNIFNHIHPKVFHFLSPKTTPTTSSSHLISFFFFNFLVTPGVQLVLLTRILADLIDCSCAGLRQVTQVQLVWRAQPCNNSVTAFHITCLLSSGTYSFPSS